MFCIVITTCQYLKVIMSIAFQYVRFVDCLDKFVYPFKKNLMNFWFGDQNKGHISFLKFIDKGLLRV